VDRAQLRQWSTTWRLTESDLLGLKLVPIYAQAVPPAYGPIAIPDQNHRRRVGHRSVHAEPGSSIYRAIVDCC